MIGKLKGLVDGYGDDLVHLDVNGVVYEAFCSSRTLAALPRNRTPVFVSSTASPFCPPPDSNSS